MFVLGIIDALTLIFGIYTFCKVLKRSKRRPCGVLLFYSMAFLTLALIILYCLTAFEKGYLDMHCFTSGIQISPGWSFAMTSIVYLWIKIKFYRVGSQVSHSERRRRELRIKHRLCSALILTLALLVIMSFIINFMVICNPLQDDKTQ